MTDVLFVLLLVALFAVTAGVVRDLDVAQPHAAITLHRVESQRVVRHWHRPDGYREIGNRVA